MAFLEISNLQKDYAGNRVVENFNLAVEQGEFVSFLGPSGCGKTTVLRMVAGFETPSAGLIRIDGKDVVNLKPNQRNIGMVFQAYALFPNMTVAQNLAFGLKVAGKSKAEIEATVKEMLALIKLEALGQRYPFQLSGGQQQRVALARALAVKPKLLLLDEPLSALDAKIRVSLREEIRAIQRKLQITTIFVTHDQEEALSMSDRIVVMHQGKADQLGTPFEIYNQPKTRFVASFVGTINVLEGKVLDAPAGRFSLYGAELNLGRSLGEVKTGDIVALALRPEAASLGTTVGKPAQLTGIVQDVNFLGSVIRVRVKVGETSLSLDSFNQAAVAPPKAGDTVMVSFAPEELLVLAD
ncbi:putative spermidine/putrescine transport system ATP-binding protein [Thiothrix eikelboomii]|uniref:Putative spermidine/putrescine transport system ATP-binding protein n=1 Tax=Thiothrix eikelboomii TaxID=92487 RepID=A0A1T4X859_9GAMM|nr:ABC transporter ATP-binding protein [Thiothrix eikelboomii]SKA85783.1 putative spermidine/putrescine transport system ATP-binding protein [Thiothrix eikelboomii]